MLTEDQSNGLNVALNESDLLGIEVDTERRIAAATFRVLSLPEVGPPPEDRRFQFLFDRVGRVAASLRDGRWDDLSAPAIPFALEDLLSVVQSFGGLSIYGWEFIDVHEKKLARWGDRLSLDWASGGLISPHSITVFQEDEKRNLDICIWYESLEIRNSKGTVVSIDDFVAAGKRWWKGFYEGDDRTNSFGMVPLKG